MRLTVKQLFYFLFLGLLLGGCSSAELAIDLMQKHQRKKIEEKLFLGIYVQKSCRES